MKLILLSFALAFSYLLLLLQPLSASTGIRYLNPGSEHENLKNGVYFERMHVFNSSLHLYKSLQVNDKRRCALQNSLSRSEAFSFQMGSPDHNCFLYKCVNLNETTEWTGGGTEIYVNKTILYLDNLALLKTTSMSTLHQGLHAPHTSANGNDNDYSTHFHTLGEYGSWWRVDLSAYSCIQAVKLTNVPDQVHWPHTADITITVSETIGDIFYTSDTGDNFCGVVEGQLNASALIACRSLMFGQFVQVQNSKQQFNHFHLVEVEVYGSQV